MDQTLKVHMHLSVSPVHRRSVTFLPLSISPPPFLFEHPAMIPPSICRPLTVAISRPFWHDKRYFVAINTAIQEI